MNDNFGLKDVIKYYKNEGYKFYNSSTIKTLKDYLDFEKYKRKNKDKLIIYIKLSSLYTKHTTKFYKKLMTILIKLFNYKYKPNRKYTKETIIFLYNDNTFISNTKYMSCKNKLLNIKNIMIDNNFNCNICFNDNCKTINICKHCNLQTCNICKNKLNKISTFCCCCKK
jgi:hypothetical protein